MTSGKTVPLNCCPMSAPSGTEIKDDIDPTTDAPTPAICPKGSIARATKFPYKIPKQKKAGIIKAINKNKGGMPFIS